MHSIVQKDTGATILRNEKDGTDALTLFNLGGVRLGSGIVSLTASTATITEDEHAGKLIVFNRAAGVTATLPAATGTGNVYTFIVGTTVTSNNDIIQVADSTDEFAGTLLQTDTDTSDTLASYPCLAADNFDTITMNGSTKGGLAGDYIQLIDIATNVFMVIGHINGTGTVATPFSSAVT